MEVLRAIFALQEQCKRDPDMMPRITLNEEKDVVFIGWSNGTQRARLHAFSDVFMADAIAKVSVGDLHVISVSVQDNFMQFSTVVYGLVKSESMLSWKTLWKVCFAICFHSPNIATWKH